MSEHTVTQLHATGSIAPSSWKGQLDTGENIFFRYRWGELTVRLEDEVNGEIIFQEQLHDDESRSHLSRGELKDLTPETIQFKL